jgi:hypothetical protein
MRLKATLPTWLVYLLVFLLGLLCGAYLFHKSLPRSFLAVGACSPHCYSEAEVAGLLSSVGLLRAPDLIPDVQMESDTCLAVRYPRPEARVHYVLFPKHDVRNIAQLTPEDEPYVMGCFAMVRELVARDHLHGYSLHTNGPDKQEIAYLHFHLLAP